MGAGEGASKRAERGKEALIEKGETMRFWEMERQEFRESEEENIGNVVEAVVNVLQYGKSNLQKQNEDNQCNVEGCTTLYGLVHYVHYHLDYVPHLYHNAAVVTAMIII